MNHRSTALLFGTLLTLTVFATPASAYALGVGDLFSIQKIQGAVVVELIYHLLTFIKDALIWSITKVAELLQSLINIRLSGQSANAGGAVVYTAWRILRDFCNMAFIGALILMAFGTIFNPLNIGFLKPYSVRAGPVISGFLVAAIVLNFSLAIGQGVVAVSDRVSTIILSLLPTNIGNNVVTAVGFAQVGIGGSGAQVQPVLENVPPGTLTPAQKSAVERWAGVDQQFFVQCLKENLDTPTGCYRRTLQTASTRQTATQQQLSRTDVIFDLNYIKELVTTGGYARSIMAAQPLISADFSRSIATIVDLLYRNFLLLTLLISLFVMFFFFVIRIPIIWLLLVLSPLAWVSLAFPGMKREGFDQWWKQFLAWNLFAPAYLLVVYFGLYLISKLGMLAGSLGGSPSVVGYLGHLFSYLMVGFVFVGGTAMVLKASFLSGTVAGQWVGNITGALGFTPGGGAAMAAYKLIGLQPRVAGAAKGLASIYERKVTAPLARGREEAEARYQAKFGDRGALEALERKRIKEQVEKNKEKGLSTDDLKKDLAGGGPKYFAAASALLDEGKLSTSEMLAYQKAAGKVSRSYENAIREKVEKKLKDTGKEKQFKYKDEKEVLAALEQYKPDPTNKDTSVEDAKKKMYEDILKKVEQTQPLVAAELATKGLYVNPNGTRRGGAEIVEGNFGALSNKDILSLIDKSKAKGGAPITDNMKRLLADKTKQLKNYLALVNTADAAQQQELAKLVDLGRQLNAQKSKKKSASKQEQQKQERQGVIMAEGIEKETEKAQSEAIKDEEIRKVMRMAQQQQGGI